MKISQEGLALIKRFEGCRLEAYKCSANVLTIGYGHTGGVKETDTITQEEADELLEKDVLKFEEYVEDNVIVELDQSQFDALVAWTFNLGPGNLRESTMLKKLNDADYASVPSEMKRWNKAGGKTLDGLIRRRNAEALLFQSKEWHQV
jgi:lysozyme|tara:strand:+ start:189 stop:632 length:444 start_codon:yes stop_codon:yes gene_type:complete